MAKKVIGEIKLQIPAGQANPSPPVGPALRQAHGVQDDQHREVGQRQELLNQKEQVGRRPDTMDGSAQQDQLAGEEEAEEQGGEQAAQGEVSPVGSRAPLHMLCDAGHRHLGRKVSDRNGRPGRFG